MSSVQQLRDTSPSITLRQQWMNWIAAHKWSVQALLGDENVVEGWGRVNPVVDRHSQLQTPDSPSEPHCSPPRMCVTMVMECTSTANRQVTTDLLYSEISLQHYDFGINCMAEPDPQLQFYRFLNMPVYLTNKLYWLLWSSRGQTRTFWFPFKHGSLTKQTKIKNKLSQKIK